MKQQQQGKKKNTEIQNQQKERSTQENKGFESKCKKTLKTCRKIVFFETSPVSFCNQTLLRTSKTPMCTISDSFFGFYVRSGFGCWTTKARLLQKNSGFRVFFFLFSSSCAQDSVHHFCPISVSPKNRAQNRALFPKTTLPYKNSGLRAKKAPKKH